MKENYMLLTEKTRKALDKLLLNEGVETKNMKAAKQYFYEKLKCNEQAAMKYIGQIKHDIPNSRLGKCKFMLAMARMYCDGELNNPDIILNLNQTLKYVASDAYINQFNQDLNGLHPQQLIDQFKDVAQEFLQQDMKDVASQQYDEQNSTYQIVKINSFEESEEYSYYVDWCVTNDEDMYISYTKDGTGVFYFCLRDGYEDEEDVKGQNCPLDDYGLSMIAVCVNSDGSCNTITCRWNHENGGNDQIMTPKQLSQVINRNFYQVFKPLTKEEQERNKQRLFYEINEEIGMQFNYYDELEDFCTSLSCDTDKGNQDERTLYAYQSEKGYVILNEEGYMVINEIFDGVQSRYGDMFIVIKDRKYNFMNMDGKIISPEWFDKASNLFENEIGVVFLKNKNKWTLINRKGEKIIPWCDSISDSIYNSLYGSDIIEVLNNGQWDYIDLNNGGYSIFNQDIAYVETMPSGVDKEFKSWRMIQFENNDYYELYDMSEGHLVCPYKFDGNVGVCHGMPWVTLKGQDTSVNYVIDSNGNFYIYDRNAKNGSKEQFTPTKPQQQMNENKKRKIIFITEEQAKNLQDIFNDPMFDNIKQFDINFVKQNKWKNGTELINYCDMCNLLCLGEGASRKVYQINDELALKIEKDNRDTYKQNEKEVQSFRNCDEDMKQFVPNIVDYDKNNVYPLWIIAEQVLPASYADFQKILGFDFGSYTSTNDITQMKQDLQDYSKYDGKKADAFSLNLMEFLEAYGEGDIALYESDIYNNKWLQELLKLLDSGIVNYWELEAIRNWGLVKRNGKPKLIILDIGI